MYSNFLLFSNIQLFPVSCTSFIHLLRVKDLSARQAMQYNLFCQLFCPEPEPIGREPARGRSLSLCGPDFHARFDSSAISCSFSSYIVLALILITIALASLHQTRDAERSLYSLVSVPYSALST